MTDYTTPPPPPPMGQPPLQPAGGKDNSKLIGLIGLLGFCCPVLGIGLGIWSLLEAKKKGGQPLWGYLAIGASVLGILVNIGYYSTR